MASSKESDCGEASGLISGAPRVLAHVQTSWMRRAVVVTLAVLGVFALVVLAVFKMPISGLESIKIQPNSLKGVAQKFTSKKQQFLDAAYSRKFYPVQQALAQCKVDSQTCRAKYAGSLACPKKGDPCISDPCQLMMIWEFLVKENKGSRCEEITHVTVQELCVSTNLVGSFQGFVKQDPNSNIPDCKSMVYGPTNLAPQLGCSQWAWAASSDFLTIFLAAVWGQGAITPSFVQKLFDAVGLYDTSPKSDPQNGYPIEYAKLTVFDKSNIAAPDLRVPAPQALFAPPLNKPTQNSQVNDAPPFVATAQWEYQWFWERTMPIIGIANPSKVCKGDKVCTQFWTVINSITPEGQRSLMTKDFAEVTQCPWTPPATPGSAGQPLDYFSRTGLYSCVDSPNTCMACPERQCPDPTAEALAAGGFTGCGAIASKCYSIQMYGNIVGNPPTSGCSAEYTDEIKLWLKDPAARLESLHQKAQDQGISAIEFWATAMFVGDDLAGSGHTGWNAWVGGIGIPGCSTECFNGQVWDPTCKSNGQDSSTCPSCCGVGSNPPCCIPTAPDTSHQFVSVAPFEDTQYEFIYRNMEPNDCMTTVSICGPKGLGPADSTGGTLACWSDNWNAAPTTLAKDRKPPLRR